MNTLDDNPSADLAATVIQSATNAFHTHKAWADKAIAQLPDDKLHLALDANTNCIAVIMKHLAGNLRSRWTDFLTTDGEKPWRDRDDEFLDTLASRDQLLACWEAGFAALFNTLAALEPADLAKSVLIRGQSHSVPLAISRSLAHTAYHTGQIILLARHFAGDNWETLTIPRGGSQNFNNEVWGQQHYGSDAPPERLA